MNQVLVNDDARLLTQVAPFVFVDDTIALKGDTAINLFVRDMSRLSVDLDPIFADYNLPRDEALGRTPPWARPRLAQTGMSGTCFARSKRLTPNSWSASRLGNRAATKLPSEPVLWKDQPRGPRAMCRMRPASAAIHPAHR